MVKTEVIEALRAVADGRPAHDLESASLDFKEVGRSVGDVLGRLAEAAACFANANGGVIIVGVRDRASGRDSFIGSPLDADATQQRIAELTEPTLVVAVEDLHVEGVRLTAVTVPRSLDIHEAKGKFTERVGTSCLPMSAKRIVQVSQARSGDDWSAQESGFATAAVDAVAVEHVRRKLRDAPAAEPRKWADLETSAILSRLGVVGPGGTLNNAGALLLTSTGRGVIDYTHRWLQSGRLTTNERLDGPALTSVLGVLDLVETRTDHTPIIMSGTGQQLFIGDVPEAAVREAIINAVMHRDYRAAGSIHVEHSNHRVSVTSPGDFVEGVSPDNVLVTTSRPRNAVLVNALRCLGLGEAAGVGVDRMVAEMLRYGHEPPTFTTDGRQVAVVLRGGPPDEVMTRFTAAWPQHWREDPDTLLVLRSLLTDRVADPEVLAPVLQKDPQDVERALRRLAESDLGLIETTPKTETRRLRSYRLTSETLERLGDHVAYRSRSADVDARIIDYVRDYDAISARVVLSMFAVAPATASRYLTDLVERGVLVKTSTAARGPSVTYGKGPKFPRATPTKKSQSKLTKSQRARDDE